MRVHSTRRTRSIVGLLSLPALMVPAWAGGQEISLVAGGDIEWSRFTKAPDVYVHPADQAEGGWLPVPYLNAEAQPKHLESTGRVMETPRTHHIASIRYDLSFGSIEEDVRYPFRNIAPVLREADIAFANLEGPLSDKARHSGAFRAPTAFADALRWAGVDVVSTANNHALDAEGEGLLDTREALWKAGVGGVGTGRDLADARRPFIIEEDIRALRDQVDFVVVSFHWTIENSQDTHPDSRDFAHRTVDAGADIILGHHPHVPGAIEVYKGKVIFYSFGNFIFGHNHDYWMDNFLARLYLTRTGVREIEILPISGRGNDLSQPSLLEGAEATELLADIQARTRLLDTSMEIRGNVGIIRP